MKLENITSSANISATNDKYYTTIYGCFTFVAESNTNSGLKCMLINYFCVLTHVFNELDIAVIHYCIKRMMNEDGKTRLHKSSDRRTSCTPKYLKTATAIAYRMMCSGTET